MFFIQNDSIMDFGRKDYSARQGYKMPECWVCQKVGKIFFFPHHYLHSKCYFSSNIV